MFECWWTEGQMQKHTRLQKQKPAKPAANDWHQPITNSHTHIEPSSIDNYKMKYSASQNYFPCQCRTPPLQYKYQSLILYVHCKHWCTSVDVWLPLLFHHRLPVTNWEERERANSIHICVLVCRYLPFYVCIGLNLSENRVSQKQSLIEIKMSSGSSKYRVGWFSFALPPPSAPFWS